MKLNKTQQAVMRQVFGFNDWDVGLSCGPQSMLVRHGSREWQFGKELERCGLARVVPSDHSQIWRIEQVKRG